MKKFLSLLLALAMVFTLAACGGNNAPATDGNGDNNSNDGSDAAATYKIGIVTGSVSQSEDDRRGAEAFQAEYGEDMVTLAIYPDNFTEELETTIQNIVNLSSDPDMKAIIVNQFPAPPRLSVRSRNPAPTLSASPASPTRTCLRSAPLPTWSATTTSCPVVI